MSKSLKCVATAFANGCSDRDSVAATKARTIAREVTPSAQRDERDFSSTGSDDETHASETISNFPTVTVPVLSKTTRLTPLTASSARPPLIKIPFFAPTPVPTMIAVGVLKPRAQGHATTTTEIHNLRHTANLLALCMRKIMGSCVSGKMCEITIHATKVTSARPTTTGTK